MKHALLALCSAALVVSCATVNREQSLVNRAVDAMGGAERLASTKTIAFKGNAKYWEPEQSDAPGGEPRFANETGFEGIIDAASHSSRIDIVRNFAYPAPRTFTFSEIVTPEAGYVIGVDSNGRNAQNMKASPPAHSMSALRLATSQRETRRGGTAASFALRRCKAVSGHGVRGRRHLHVLRVAPVAVDAQHIARLRRHDLAVGERARRGISEVLDPVGAARAPVAVLDDLHGRFGGEARLSAGHVRLLGFPMLDIGSGG